MKKKALLLFAILLLSLVNLSFFMVPTPVQASPDDTATFYSTSSDGYAYYEDANYTVAHDATSAEVVQDFTTYDSIGQRLYTGQYNIYRAFLFFNTSTLGSNAVISSATLSLYGQADNSATDFNITIQNGQPTYPHDPLVAGDYDQSLYSGDGGYFDTGNFQVNAYNDIALSSTGVGWINKTGWTKLCLRSSKDINSDTPTGLEYVKIYFNEEGSGKQPKLTITYTLQYTVYVTDDSYVSQANPDSNYGSGIILEVRNITADVRRSFVKFNISSIPSGYGVQSAKLRFRQQGKPTGGTQPIEIYAVTDDMWTEGTITWNNKPSLDDYQTENSSSSTGIWVEFTVTSFVKSEYYAGQQNVSFGLKAENEALDNNGATYEAKEHYDQYKAQLVVTCVANSAPSNQSITISNLEDVNYLYGLKTAYNFVTNFSDPDGYAQLDFGKIAFTDGSSWINVTIDLQSLVVTVESGSSLISVGAVSRTTSVTSVQVTTPITLLTGISNADNIELYLWCNDTEGVYDSWEAKQTDYAHIRKAYACIIGTETYYVVGSAKISSATVTGNVLDVSFALGQTGNFKLYSNCTRPKYVLRCTYDFALDWASNLLNLDHSAQRSISIGFPMWGNWYIRGLTQGVISSVSYVNEKLTLALAGAGSGTLYVMCTDRDVPQSTGGFDAVMWNPNTKLFTGDYTSATDSKTVWLNWKAEGGTPAGPSGGAEASLMVLAITMEEGIIQGSERIIEIPIDWSGSNQIHVLGIDFLYLSEWFALVDKVPFALNENITQPDSTYGKVKVRLNVPRDATPGIYNVNFLVRAETVSRTQLQYSSSLTFTVEKYEAPVAPSVGEPMTYIFLIAIGLILVYVFLKRK